MWHLRYSIFSLFKYSCNVITLYYSLPHRFCVCLFSLCSFVYVVVSVWLPFWRSYLSDCLFLSFVLYILYHASLQWPPASVAFPVASSGWHDPDAIPCCKVHLQIIDIGVIFKSCNKSLLGMIQPLSGMLIEDKARAKTHNLAGTFHLSSTHTHTHYYTQAHTPTKELNTIE